METCSPEREEPTISTLDEQISNIVRRLSDISTTLYDGIYGNQTKSEADECSSPMESASLISIQRRCDLAQTLLVEIERLSSKIHSSNITG